MDWPKSYKKFKGEWSNGSNILGLVFFAIVLGVALATLGEKGKPLLAFFTSLSDAMMKITTWVINLAPVGVFFLIGGQVLGTDDFATVLSQLGWYFSTVLIGEACIVSELTDITFELQGYSCTASSSCLPSSL